MTVQIRRIEGKYRLIELETGKPAVTKNDVPVDGGGHESLAAAMRQSEYVNKAPRREPDEGSETTK